MIGVGIFGTASLMSGMSGDVNQLILGAPCKASAAVSSLQTPSRLSATCLLLANAVSGRVLFGAVFGLSSVIGPLLGGWLTDHNNVFGLTTDWRWTFFINVPVAVTAFILIAVFCPLLRHDKKPVIDYAGAVLLTVALGTLVLAVDNTDAIFADLLSNTGMSLMTLRVIMGANVAVTAAAFIWVEQKSREPILPLRFFENRNFVLIMGIATLFGAAFMGSILYLTQFNQQVFGASPTESGLMLLPMIVGLMATSITSGQIISNWSVARSSCKWVSSLRLSWCLVFRH